MKFTLRQLQVFEAVAACGSVVGAAERLGMSQSAASEALKDLQIILRRPLFTHVKGRTLQLTEEGKRLRPMIRSMLQQADEIERTPEAEMEGRLLVGATAMIAETMLPELCVKFRERHPGVQIMLQAESQGELFERLQRMELDTAVIEYFPDLPAVELTRWRSDELWLVVAPGHPLASRDKLRLRDLAGFTWCAREAMSSVTVRLRVLLHEEVGRLPAGIETTSNQAVRLAAIAGGGVACLSSQLVKADVESGRLVRLHVRDFSFTRALSIARPKGVWRSRVVAAFEDFLLEHAAAE
ncbi:LysR family transcriptional regulator [Phenylobacterium sp. LjRoot225]|uniref:LysR family transcriptional regulator n=1 Tax=Phenylobacterium sp. LjRoot225 TaxID=3342285 RepID=UPI003ECC7A7E